jgi:hypothetical protein
MRWATRFRSTPSSKIQAVYVNSGASPFRDGEVQYSNTSPPVYFSEQPLSVCGLLAYGSFPNVVTHDRRCRRCRAVAPIDAAAKIVRRLTLPRLRLPLAPALSRCCPAKPRSLPRCVVTRVQERPAMAVRMKSRAFLGVCP